MMFRSSSIGRFLRCSQSLGRSRHTLRRTVLFIVVIASCVLLGVLLCNLYTVFRTRAKVYTGAEDAPKVETALVLGTQVGSPFLKHRMDTAAALFEAGKVSRFLVSGSFDGGYYDEAGAMREGLVKRGVPYDAIVCDRAGYRTLDSVVRAHRVYGLETATIVSQRFHLYRALLIAREEGLDATAVAASAPPLAKMRRVQVREWLARVLAVLDLYVWQQEPRSLGESPRPYEHADGGAEGATE